MLTSIIDNLQEVAVDKQTCQNPARNDNNEDTEIANKALKTCAHSQTVATAKARTKEIPRCAESGSKRKRAKQQHKQKAQRKMVQLQRLIAEQSPADNDDDNGDNQCKDAETATHKRIGNRGAHLTAHIAETGLCHRVATLHKCAHIALPIEEIREDGA